MDAHQAIPNTEKFNLLYPKCIIPPKAATYVSLALVLDDEFLIPPLSAKILTHLEHGSNPLCECPEAKTREVAGGRMFQEGVRK